MPKSIHFDLQIIRSVPISTSESAIDSSFTFFITSGENNCGILLRFHSCLRHGKRINQKK